MALEKFLSDQGYDLIEGPVRAADIRQLWLKKSFNEVEILEKDIDAVFNSPQVLDVQESKALNVNSSLKDTFQFQIGASVLDDRLSEIGLGDADFTSKFKSGKSISISYDEAFVKELYRGQIERYLERADFKYKSRLLLKNLNRNNVLIISGIMYAKNLITEFESSSDIDADLEAELNAFGEGKLKFNKTSHKKMRMEAGDGNPFPIAIKAHRFRYRNGRFINLNLLTDNRDLF